MAMSRRQSTSSDCLWTMVVPMVPTVSMGQTMESILAHVHRPQNPIEDDCDAVRASLIRPYHRNHSDICNNSNPSPSSARSKQ